MATGGEHTQELKGSDQVVDFSCTFCSENEGLITEAQFYCKQCSKCFCTECVTLHNGLYKKHAVSGRGEKDVWPVNESNLGIEKCDQHPDKDIELFCEDHRQLCCLLCQFTYHRSCAHVVFVAEKEQGYQPTVDIQTSIANIESQLIHVKEMLSFRDKKNISLQESYEKTSEDIKARRKHFDEMFDKIEKNTIRDLDNKMEELKDTLKSDMANLSHLDVNLKRLNAAISAQTRKGDPLTFMMEMKYMNIISTSERILDDLVEGNDAVITFEGNAEIESCVENIMSFGQFCISKNPSTTLACIGPKRIEQHCIRMSHERVCDIRGICELSNGTLVIADRTNYSIKVLDDKYNVVHHMRLDFSPNDICCVSSTKVAVAMNSMTGGQIIVLNVTTKNVTVENTFNFKHKCTGITSSAYSMFVTTNTALLQYKMTAAMEFVKTIYEDISSFLTVNKCAKRTNRQKIYVTNYNHSQILEISRDGTEEVINRTKYSRNPTPTGVHVTALGQVLICCYSPNTVLMIDEDGQYTTLAGKTDGVKRPQSVYYSKMRRDIIVGQSCNRLLVIKNCI